MHSCYVELSSRWWIDSSPDLSSLNRAFRSFMRSCTRSMVQWVGKLTLILLELLVSLYSLIPRLLRREPGNDAMMHWRLKSGNETTVMSSISELYLWLVCFQILSGPAFQHLVGWSGDYETNNGEGIQLLCGERGNWSSIVPRPPLFLLFSLCVKRNGRVAYIILNANWVAEMGAAWEQSYNWP